MSNETTTGVHLTKSFTQSKDQLYRAWTEPGELKQWWKPMGKQLVYVENDIKPGGNIVYRFDDDLEVHGTYKEADEGVRLVYSWIWDLPEESLHRGSYLLTVEFREIADGSELEITQENFKDEHAIKPHQSGWEEALEALHQYLSGKPEKD